MGDDGRDVLRYFFALSDLSDVCKEGEVVRRWGLLPLDGVLN
jgi:hypothetical protein